MQPSKKSADQNPPSSLTYFNRIGFAAESAAAGLPSPVEAPVVRSRTWYRAMLCAPSVRVSQTCGAQDGPSLAIPLPDLAFQTLPVTLSQSCVGGRSGVL